MEAVRNNIKQATDNSYALLLSDVADRAAKYLSSLGTRSVAPAEEAFFDLSRFDEPLPETGISTSHVIEILDTIGSPATMGMAGPRFFGFVIGGSLPAALAANWLATAWDQNTGLWQPTPTTSYLEKVAEKWLIELLNLPRECSCGFVTGATMANFTALAAARNSVLRTVGWDVEADGLIGAPPVTIVVGEEAHPTLFKSLGLLGFGRNRVVRVPVDNQGRMRVGKLPRLEGAVILCAQAGNVNTGACDPVGQICEQVKRNGVWVHVDGAFGLWAAASPRKKVVVTGIELADSWATDAHKWLNVPYDSGVAIVRDAAALRAAMAISAAYLPTTDERKPSDYTPELSRRARGVDVWAALKSLGKAGVAELIDQTCDNAALFAQELSKAGFEILNDVVLNQVLVSFGESAITEKVIQEIQEEGTCWCGVTVWQGKTAMRISVSSWRTTREDVEKSLDVIIRIASKYRRR